MLAVFGSVEKAAAKARQRVAKESQAGAQEMAGPYRTNARQAAEAVQDFGAKGATSLKSIGKVADGAADRFKALVKSVKATGPELALVAKTAEAELKRIQTAEAKAALGIGGGSGGGGGSRFGRRVGYWSMRNFSPVTPTLSIGKRIAGDVARGAGLPTDVSSYVQSFVERQKQAADIVNSGYIEGAKGANGQRQDPNAVRAESLAIAKNVGVGAGDVQGGLQKFVGFTGDLETGRAVLGDMAKLSVATHSSMEDVAGAAGKISKNLGDVPNKAEKINDVMLALAGMGKTGAAELPDFAAQLSKLAPLASRFGGERSQNLATMGVLLQLAASGGAGTPRAAATSAARFVDTFKKGTSIKAWSKLGLGYDATHDARDNLRSPRELMLMALEKTQGAQQSRKLASLFQSGPAGQVIEPLRQAFTAAGGGKAGLAAAGEVFDQLARSGMTLAERDRELAQVHETTQNRVERFKASLEEITDSTMSKLAPALEQLAPKVEGAVGVFGELLTWAASNPFGAVETALAGSIVKAGLENTLRLGIEKAFSSEVVGASLAGALAAALTGAAVGVTVGVLTVNAMSGVQLNDQKKQAAADIDVANALGSNDPLAIGSALTKEKGKDLSNPWWQDAYTSVLAGLGSANSMLSAAGGSGMYGDIAPGKSGDHSDDQGAEILHLAQKEHADRVRDNTDSIARLTAALEKFSGKMPVQADKSGTMPANGQPHGPRGISYGGG